MRILLANHLPWNVAASGRLMARLVQGLRHLGHDVRSLAIDDGGHASQLGLRRVMLHATSPATAPPCPRFTADAAQGLTFDALTASQLGEYRQALRTALDDEIDQFDPHIVHAMHVWVWAHLALETGVPYVATAMIDELDALRHLPHNNELHELAQQAAENAGRIVLESTSLTPRVHEAFGDVEERLLVLPPREPPGDDVTYIQALADAYRLVITERFGAPPSR